MVNANRLWLLAAVNVIAAAVCTLAVEVEMTMNRVSDAGAILEPVVLRVYLAIAICWGTFFVLRSRRRRMARKNAS